MIVVWHRYDVTGFAACSPSRCIVRRLTSKFGGFSPSDCRYQMGVGMTGNILDWTVADRVFLVERKPRIYGRVTQRLKIEKATQRQSCPNTLIYHSRTAPTFGNQHAHKVPACGRSADCNRTCRNILTAGSTMEKLRRGPDLAYDFIQRGNWSESIARQYPP